MSTGAPLRRLGWALITAASLALALLIAAFALGPGRPSPAAAAATSPVSISGSSFQPGSITVNTGDTVTWTNFDGFQHTTTSNSGVWGSSPLGQNQTFSFTFTSPGSYAYHCAIHSFMTGSVVVNAPANTATATATTTPTSTATGTATPTSTASPTPTTAPATATNTATSTATVTPTSTPTATATPPPPTPTPTATSTPPPPTPTPSLGIHLDAGWNQIALPFPPASPKTAEGLLNEISGQGMAATLLAHWVSGAWQSHLQGFPANDFPVEPGRGYFVRVGQPGTWTPRDEATPTPAAGLTSIQLCRSYAVDTCLDLGPTASISDTMLAVRSVWSVAADSTDVVVGNWIDPSGGLYASITSTLSTSSSSLTAVQWVVPTATLASGVWQYQPQLNGVPGPSFPFTLTNTPALLQPTGPFLVRSGLASEFSTTVPSITLTLTFGNAAGVPLTIERQWYAPDGTLYYDNTTTVTSTTWLSGRSSSLNVVGTAAAAKPGQWYVDVYAQGELVRRRTFLLGP